MKQKLSFFIFLLTVGLANAQVEEKKLDELIQNTLKTFDVPGMSVGIVKDGKMIYSKGFGVRSLTSKQPMDDNTLVGIASNSKGFTCTALAILADEGKLNWDDKVSKYIPEFQMYDLKIVLFPSIEYEKSWISKTSFSSQTLVHLIFFFVMDKLAKSHE